MHLLVINSGSSSIKFSIFEAGEARPVSRYEGELSGIGTEHAAFVFGEANEGAARPKPESVVAKDSSEAIGYVVRAISGDIVPKGYSIPKGYSVPKIDAVGYRVVHPGERLHSHVIIDDEVLRDLDEAVVFAPLHDPSAIKIIRELMQQMPKIPHIACFDTIFHQTMPEVASAYAIPDKYREEGVKRYGFHGLSCESIVEQMYEAGMTIPWRMAIAHLGSGCSVTALIDGATVDTSMGLTPTGGVVMGTRPGDVDPGLVLYLLRDMPGDREESFSAVEQLINKSAGISALAGLRNDMRETREAAQGGNERARLAINVFTRSVRKTLGGYAWLMGGLDAIVFTGGIGEHDAATRAEIVADLEEMGVVLDASANTTAAQGDIHHIAAAESKVELMVIPAKEDWMIARHMQEMLGLRQTSDNH